MSEEDASSTTMTTEEPTATRSNLNGPLMTVFTPPSSCTEQLWYTGSGVEFPSGYFLGHSCSTSSSASCLTETPSDGDSTESCSSFASYLVTADWDCWPPMSGTQYWPHDGFYSPAIHCPKGHTMACEATYSGDENWEPQHPLTEGETAAGCCPSGYKCQKAGSTQRCTRTVTSAVSGLIYNDCYSNDNSDARSDVDGTDFSYAITAPLYQIHWRSVDVETTATSTPEPKQTETEAPDPDEDSGDGLSTGAKAGIGAGAGLAGLALIAFLLWFFLFKKRKGGANGPAAYEVAATNYPPSASELPDGSKYEMSAGVDGVYHPQSYYGGAYSQTVSPNPSTTYQEYQYQQPPPQHYQYHELAGQVGGAQLSPDYNYNGQYHSQYGQQNPDWNRPYHEMQ